MMKFNTLDELIDFDKNLEYVKESEINLSNYKLNTETRNRYNRLKGRKLFGVYNDKIVTVVSDQFTPISVSEIVEACEKSFGANYEEKSFKQGIVRIYENGAEDKTGKVSPIAIFPPNTGKMAVIIGLYHNASVCSNGCFFTDGKISKRIIHRMNNKVLEYNIKTVSNNLGLVLKKIGCAQEKHIGKGMQLGMIIQGLGKKDGLVKKAFSKYAPETDTLWDTVQTITYVSTHETKKGFEHSKKAGDYLLEEKLDPRKVLDAVNYVYDKEKSNTIKFDNSSELYALGVMELQEVIL